MNLPALATLIFGFGSAGGLVNCILAGSRRLLPGYDGRGAWHSGWTGSLFLGGVAAVLIWGIYGSSASFDLLGKEEFAGHLTLAQLLTSVVVGMGGSRILTLEAQKVILRSERDAEEVAKENVAATVRTILAEEKIN